MMGNHEGKGRTAYRKIVDAHLVRVLQDDSLEVSPDMYFCHEITTSPGIVDVGSRGCDVVCNPNKVKAMVDHVSPAGDEATAFQHKVLREWCAKHGIEFRESGHGGICHALIPQSGWLLPGMIGIMGDSHTCTGGAFCALMAGVGTSELMASIGSDLWILSPQRVIRVNYIGTLPANVFSKDLILALIAKIGVDGATNAVLEFGGPVIDRMDMEARMTIANMAVEAGATSGMMMVDGMTLEYLQPVIDAYGIPKEDLVRWNSDHDAEYDEVIDIDVTKMVPLMTVSYTPADVVSVASMDGDPFNQGFIGSCTNGRLSDLRIAARVMKAVGGKIDSSKVRCIVIPATQHIYLQALLEGLIQIFLEAGCVVANPSCGPCLGMSCGVIADGEVCVSTSNRNFEGRMGKGGMVHLCSPATTALSVMKGVVTEPGIDLCSEILNDIDGMEEDGRWSPVVLSDWEDVDGYAVPNYAALHEKTRVVSDPEFSGEVFFLPKENINTDLIIRARYLTTSKKTGLGEYCLEGIDMTQEERSRLHRSTVLVAGMNFGCGSSREHAPWSLQEAGIRCVIAPSFARIFRSSMFANGLLCVALPEGIVARLFEIRPERVEVLPDEGMIRVGIEGADDWEIPFDLTYLQKELLRKGGIIPLMLEHAAMLRED